MNTKPFGGWKSVITAEYVAGKSRNMTANIQVDGENIYFLEARPDEGGRLVLMKKENEKDPVEILPKEFNIRTRYLEYGGNSLLIEDENIYFVNFSDQQIYHCEVGQTPEKLTNEENTRFSDLVLDKKRNRLIALREVLQEPESKNSICCIYLKDRSVEDLVAGNDFYNSARINTEANQIVWTTWNHPNMAWNGTEFWMADIDEAGKVTSSKKIAGDNEHAVSQVRWSSDGKIYFTAELDNWSNLYSYSNAEIKNFYPLEAEFSRPDWVPGQQQYAIHSNGTLCSAFIQNGRYQLLLIDNFGKHVHEKSFDDIASVYPYKDGFVFVAKYQDEPSAIYYIDGSMQLSVVHSSEKHTLSSGDVSLAEEFIYKTEDGGEGYAWYYPPKNANFTGVEGEKPPLIVMCHGGPTAMSSSVYSKGQQFWTNRGYAVVDVNYGGSTGYGRAYRERLRGSWGKVDVSDCVSVVKQLASDGKIDSKRVAIRGGSAGGYTTLAALAFTDGIFSVGASYYGVSELEFLAKETHKLESRYLDQLVGPYPEALELYKERSPIESIDAFNCPMIFFQGDEDKVVPANQSEMMHESLKKKDIPTDYHLYAGEGHGFRKSENIQHSLKAEHNFYARFFGFDVQDEDRV